MLSVVLAGGAASAWSVVARAQQRPTPVMTSGFTSVILYFEAMAVLAFIGELFAPEDYRRKL